MASVNTVSGTVEAKARTGKSIKVGEDWYGVYSSTDLDHVSTGDSVVFNFYEKGRFKNIKGKVRVSGGGDTTTAPASKNNYNLGVELGHASKLAMDMALASGQEVGSKDFYKFWVEHTENVHRMMTALRDKHSAPKSDFSESTDDEEDVVVYEKSKAAEKDEEELVTDIF